MLSRCNFYANFYQDTVVCETITIEPDITRQNRAGCHIKNAINELDLIDTEIREM